MYLARISRQRRREKEVELARKKREDELEMESLMLGGACGSGGTQ